MKRALLAVLALGVAQEATAQVSAIVGADTRLAPASNMPAFTAGGSLQLHQSRWTASAVAALSALDGSLGYQGEYRVETIGLIGFSARGSVERPVNQGPLGEQTGFITLTRQFGPATLRLSGGGLLTRGDLTAGGTMSGAVRMGEIEVTAEVGRFQALEGGAAVGMPGLATSDRDTLNPDPQPPSQPLRALSHATLGASWRHGKMELSGRVLTRTTLGTTGGSMGWQLGLAVGPLNGVRLRLGFGEVPTGTSFYLPYRKQVLFGFEMLRTPRLRPRPHDPAEAAEPVAVTVRQHEGTTTIAITARDARTVEIAGDFTEWVPVELRRERGRWVIDWPLEPGTYRCNIRIDGGPWTVPDGLPSVQDDFGGEVGVLVVD